jgi:hypothetical protein
MKQSNTIILVIVAAVGLLVVLTIGLYVRNTWQTNSTHESEAVTEPDTKHARKTTKPARKDRQSSRTLSPEQRAQIIEQIENIKQRWANMSEAEREEFRGKMVQIFDAGRPQSSRKFETSPPEGRDKFGEQFLEIKNKWEDMSEAERKEFMEKMRESANAIRQGND